MNKKPTYEQVHPLVQSVEIVSDMIQCHFHCPIKSKKIVAITRLSQQDKQTKDKEDNWRRWLKCTTLFEIKKYFGRFEESEVAEKSEIDKENAILYAFEKISERFVWSDEHGHFIYRF